MLTGIDRQGLGMPIDPLGGGFGGRRGTPWQPGSRPDAPPTTASPPAPTPAAEAALPHPPGSMRLPYRHRRPLVSTFPFHLATPRCCSSAYSPPPSRPVTPHYQRTGRCPGGLSPNPNNKYAAGVPPRHASTSWHVHACDTGCCSATPTARLPQAHDPTPIPHALLLRVLWMRVASVDAMVTPSSARGSCLPLVELDAWLAALDSPASSARPSASNARSRNRCLSSSSPLKERASER
jgi:hypothetical protein